MSDKVGMLAPGMNADFIVLPRAKGQSALLALLKAQPGSGRLVVIGGRPIMGDPELMGKLTPGRQLDSVTVCGEQKALDIADDTGGKSWKEIESHIATELQAFHISLAPLAECD